MKQKTGYKDEAGAEIFSGDSCILDSGYAHKAGIADGFRGFIEQDLSGNFWFVHESCGNKVSLSKVHGDLRVT